MTASSPPPIETGHEPIPRWVIAVGAGVVLVGVLALGGGLEGTNPDLIGGGPTNAPPPSGEPPPSGAPPSAGGADAVALIEQAGCQNCHGVDLAGQGNFPSLHGLADGPKSENLQPLAADHPDDWPNLWIDGTGPEVAGLDRGGMPQFGDGQLTTEDIATIVEYLYTLP
ncbi:MAG TPA: cytochrome c [Candidatus Limnocylindria bacterium]|jgi:mono/diheme cytochrome c family protein